MGNGVLEVGIFFVIVMVGFFVEIFVEIVDGSGF